VVARLGQPSRSSGYFLIDAALNRHGFWLFPDGLFWKGAITLISQDFFFLHDVFLKSMQISTETVSGIFRLIQGSNSFCQIMKSSLGGAVGAAINFLIAAVHNRHGFWLFPDALFWKGAITLILKSMQISTETVLAGL